MENKFCKVCATDNLVFVKYIMSNGVIMIRKQCDNCGRLELTNYKRALFNMDELRFVDNEKRQKLGEQNILNSKLRRETDRYYNDVYLRSEIWRNKRQIILKRDKNKCVCCDSPASDIHHITYDRIYKENFEDLISVCRSCHQKIHFEGDVSMFGFNAKMGVLKCCQNCKHYHNGEELNICDTCKNN